MFAVVVRSRRSRSSLVPLPRRPLSSPKSGDTGGMQVLPRRLRAWLLLLAPALLLAGPPLAAQQPAAPGPVDRTEPDDPRRPADHRRHAAQRDALLRAPQPAAARPRRTAAGGQGRLGAGRRRPARAGALRRAHGVQRDAELPPAGDRHLHAGDRDALRRARQRPHQLRRDGLRAADSDHRCPRHRPGAADHGGLGQRRDVRSRRSRQGTRRHPRGMAAGPWRRRAHAEHHHADPAEGIALRGAVADRHARQHPQRALRAAEAVLHRLVSPRPDGGDRRRRLRSRGDRSRHQGALRADSRRRVAASRARPIPSRRTPGTLYAVATDREATNTTVGSDRQDAGARPAHRRHVPAADGGAAVRRHAVRSAGRDLAHA